MECPSRHIAIKPFISKVGILMNSAGPSGSQSYTYTHKVPGHPQGDGPLKAFIKGDQPKDWVLSLGRASLEQRATVYPSAGILPFKMLPHLPTKHRSSK